MGSLLGAGNTRAPPGLAKLILPVLSSVRLRNKHCRPAGHDPPALQPMTSQLCSPSSLRAMQEGTGLQAAHPCPSCWSHELSDSVSSCCRTWLLPCAVRMGTKEVDRLGELTPVHVPMSTGVHIPSPPLQPVGQSGVGVPAGPCSPVSPASLQGPPLSAGRLCGSERSSLHVCVFVSIPHGAAGVVLAPLPCLRFQQRAARCQCRSCCGFDVT